jgi:uncharacterized protein (TIGR03437 family)
VSLSSPSSEDSFVTGDSVTISANAADTDGQVVRVDFLSNGQLLASDNSEPYSFVWTNVPSGVFTITAKATDNSGASTSSAGVFLTVVRSPSSVNHSLVLANQIVGGFEWSQTTYPGAGGGSPNYAVVANLDALAFDIQQAHSDFTLERNLFGSAANQIDSQLMAAYYFARADAALAAQTGPSPNTKAHLQRLIGHLTVTGDLMRYGSITPATMQFAILVNARMDLVIGSAGSGLGPAADGFVSPESQGSLFGNATVAPLSTQTTFADMSSNNALPFELDGVSISIAGHAVPVMYVSPARVTFLVPTDLPGGENEVIVVSQSGYVSKGLISVESNVTRIMTAAGDESGVAFALNDYKQVNEEFSVNTPQNLGADKRTRVTFFATGVSGSAANSDASNDVVADGKVWVNVAESVTVEARTPDNRVYQLPVEFAGAKGVPGLDQINVILVPQLQDAGTASLTLIVNGRRSNAPTIRVK